MSTDPVPPSGDPLLVDEVDVVVEYQEAGAPGVGDKNSEEPKLQPQSVLTDVVDHLVEFVDRAMKPATTPSSPPNGSIFVDTVDQIEEFVDRPIPTSVEV